MVRGPLRSYLPKPTKSILAMSPRNVPRAESFFRGYGLQIVMGRRYLRGFMGSEAAQNLWLGEKVGGWRDSVATLAEVARQNWHTAYAGL